MLKYSGKVLYWKEELGESESTWLSTKLIYSVSISIHEKTDATATAKEIYNKQVYQIKEGIWHCKWYCVS